MSGKAHNRDLLMLSISKFYSNRAHVQRILPMISGDSRISLRLIDWFVTNYAKNHSIVLLHTINGHQVHFNVYTSYRAQLKAYSKQQFDPFRRRDRIDFYYDKNQYLETTIGQLNFFRWMLQNHLIEYLENNADAIEHEMVACQRNMSLMKGTSPPPSRPTTPDSSHESPPNVEILEHDLMSNEASPSPSPVREPTPLKKTKGARRRAKADPKPVEPNVPPEPKLRPPLEPVAEPEISREPTADIALPKKRCGPGQKVIHGRRIDVQIAHEKALTTTVLFD